MSADWDIRYVSAQTHKKFPLKTKNLLFKNVSSSRKVFGGCLREPFFKKVPSSFPLNNILQCMFRPFDDFRLHRRGKPYEIIAVAADAHHKVFVLFRMLPRFFENFPACHVDLHLESPARQIGSYQ